MNRTDGLSEVTVIIPTALAVEVEKLAVEVEKAASKDQRGGDKIVELALGKYLSERIP